MGNIKVDIGIRELNASIQSIRAETPEVIQSALDIVQNPTLSTNSPEKIKDLAKKINSLQKSLKEAKNPTGFEKCPLKEYVEGKLAGLFIPSDRKKSLIVAAAEGNRYAVAYLVDKQDPEDHLVEAFQAALEAEHTDVVSDLVQFEDFYLVKFAIKKQNIPLLDSLLQVKDLGRKCLDVMIREGVKQKDLGVLKVLLSNQECKETHTPLAIKEAIVGEHLPALQYLLENNREGIFQFIETCTTDSLLKELESLLNSEPMGVPSNDLKKATEMLAEKIQNFKENTKGA